MLGTWSPPSEGVAVVKISAKVDKTLQLLNSLPKQDRPTLTHFVTKAIGVLLQQCPDLNGKLVFGKFVQYKTADICCLVDIDGGKDLAIVLVEDVGNKSVYDIQNFIKSESSKIKKDKGDTDHKKRTGVAKFLPAFVVAILIKITTFICHSLGLSIPPLSLKKDQFGAACITSLGMLGFIDATAPFSGFTGNTMIASLNQVHDEVVAQDGKVVVRKIVNINFAVDHRYIDGGRCKKLIPAFQSVFENPQKFLRSSGKIQSNDKKTQ